MKKKLLIIMGESSSGKDTIAHICENKYGMKPVISYATRPMRPNETNGKEHWFIDDKKMEELKARDDMVAYTYINDPTNNSKGYEYCAMLENLQDADMYIIDPLGYENMIANGYGEYFDTIRIHIYAPFDVRRERAIKRGIKDIKEFDERYENERVQFENARNSHAYEYFIDNSSITKEELENEVRKVLLESGFIG